MVGENPILIICKDPHSLFMICSASKNEFHDICRRIKIGKLRGSEGNTFSRSKICKYVLVLKSISSFGKVQLVLEEGGSSDIHLFHQMPTIKSSSKFKPIFLYWFIIFPFSTWFQFVFFLLSLGFFQIFEKWQFVHSNFYYRSFHMAKFFFLIFLLLHIHR